MTKRRYASDVGISVLRKAVSEDTGLPEWKCLYQLACMFVHEHPDKFHADVVTVATGVSEALGLTLEWNKAGAQVETMREYWRDVDDVVQARLARLKAGQINLKEKDDNE